MNRLYRGFASAPVVLAAVSISALFFLAPTDAAASDCLDYDSVLPIVGRNQDVTELIAVDVLQSWAFAIDVPEYAVYRLVVFSIVDPEAPEIVAELPLPNHSESILCRDGRAYIHTSGYSSAVLVIVNIHDPTDPWEMGRLTVPDQIDDLDVEGNLCVLAADNAGVLLVNVAAPSLMSVIGTFVPPSWQGDPRAVDLRGDRLLVGLDDNNDGYFYWLDVANPAQPSVVGSLFIDTAIYQVQLQGDEPTALFSTYNTLQVLDLSDPQNLQVLGGRIVAGSHALLFDDMALTYGDYYGDSQLVDITDPTEPRWLAGKNGFAFDAARKSDYLVLAQREAGLGIARISDPAAVPIVGVDYSGFGGSRLVATADPNLILALRDDDVRLVDVSDPTQPIPRDSQFANDPFGATVQGSLVYVLDDDTCRLLDLADPDNIRWLGSVLLPEGITVLLWEGDRLYAAAASEGLVVFDVSDPLQPLELGRMDTFGWASNLIMHQGYIVLADGFVGLKVIDVADPTAPFVVGEVGGNLHSQQLTSSGTRVFTGGSQIANLVEIDVSDPAAPTIVATLPLPSAPNALLVHDGRLWASHHKGMSVFDLGEPGGLVPSGVFEAHDPTRGLAACGDYVATTLYFFLTVRPPCPVVTAVDAVPTAVSLQLRATPNPFNPRTRIDFALPRAAECRLTVHDLAGRRLRTLWHGELDAGEHRFVWEGRDSGGRALPSGVYLVRLVAGEKSASHKLVLIR